jgi:diaminopimelate epimerase
MIEFIKMSGAGNDFIIIDGRKNNYQFSADQIAKISARHNIGCDQFILLEDCLRADIFMHIYNSNGSRSGACGNATRCVASLLFEENLQQNELKIKTDSGILTSKKENGDLICVNMGQPKFAWQDIPLSRKIETNSFSISPFDNFSFSAVNMGNPHIVSFVKQDLNDKDFFNIAPQLEVNPLFTQKTNVEFARIISPNHINVHVWERGVGETLACGSGACAVVVAAINNGLVEKNQRVKVSFKGGDLFILWQKNGVIMSGDVQKIFKGVLDENFLS